MARLSQLDLKILGVLGCDARRPLHEVARECKVKLHTVQHSFRKLTSQNVAFASAGIDLFKLGLNQYQLMFSPLGGEKNAQRCQRFLTNSSEVVWSAEISGAQRYNVAVTVSSIAELRRWMNRAFKEAAITFQGRTFAEVEKIIFFPRKYLLPQNAKTAPLNTIRCGVPQLKVDELDLKILNLIRHNVLPSGSSIARSLGQPIPTINYRLRQLEDKGVIWSNWLRIDIDKIGRQFTKILVSLVVNNEQEVKRLETFCADHSLVTVFMQCFGAWDFEISIEVGSPTETLSFLNDLAAFFNPGQLEIHAVLPVLNRLPDYKGMPPLPSVA